MRRYLILLFVISDLISSAQKINGLCTVAPPYEVLDEHFDPIVEVHANWIAVIPYAFCDPENSKIIYDHPRQWQGEKPEGVAKAIKLAKKRNLKIMIKPHLWVKSQGWAGDLDFDSKDELLIWQNSYRDYLLVYAQLADSLGVDLLSVGTELKKLILTDEEYWVGLICDIRNVYEGKLTYSANWDNYERISFWSNLDYIGIDAYFPVNEENNPSVPAVVKSFGSVKRNLRNFSTKNNRPILFTEFGFRSIDQCANGHWIGDYEKGTINMECQKNAYLGIFETFWSEQWFAGGFLWKWYFKNEESGGKSDEKFTPQNKPSLAEICIQYSK